MLSTDFFKLTIFIRRLVNQEFPGVIDINISSHYDINRYVISVLVLWNINTISLFFNYENYFLAMKYEKLDSYLQRLQRRLSYSV